MPYVKSFCVRNPGVAELGGSGSGSFTRWSPESGCCLGAWDPPPRKLAQFFRPSFSPRLSSWHDSWLTRSQWSKEERKLKMGAIVPANLDLGSDMPSLLPYSIGHSGTVWEGTSYHFAILLESESQNATTFPAIPLTHMTVSSRRKRDLVSFKSKPTFVRAPPLDSPFLMGQNWVTCIHMNWSPEVGMGSWFGLD